MPCKMVYLVNPVSSGVGGSSSGLIAAPLYIQHLQYQQCFGGFGQTCRSLLLSAADGSGA